MNGNVYAKTDKGREEIATRKNQLPARLRSLLLMIDGQRALESLPGVNDENVAILLQGDYIVLNAAEVAPPPKTALTPAPKASAAPRPAPTGQANLHDIYSSRYRDS